MTNFYREGMLCKQIEGKPERGLPLFQRAAANWDKLTAEEKQTRQQERKNTVETVFMTPTGHFWARLVPENTNMWPCARPSNL